MSDKNDDDEEHSAFGSSAPGRLSDLLRSDVSNSESSMEEEAPMESVAPLRNKRVQPARKVGPRRPPPREPAEPGGDAPTLLARIGRTSVELSLNHAPWGIVTDAVVVPTDRRRGRGQFARAFMEGLGEDHPLIHALSIELSRDEPYGPDDVLTVRSEEAGSSPSQLILAAPFEHDHTRSSEGPARRATAGALQAAVEHGCRSILLPVLGAAAGNLEAKLAARAAVSALRETPATTELERVILTTLNPEVANELRDLLRTHAQSFSNDVAGGEDLLRVRGEIEALTDMLLLRDTSPPLVVGVLGGWGSGKSFAMHLMRERILELRSWPVSDAQAWDAESQDGAALVGHVYPITFDAWTFAKGNLWASLMQTVFLELDRQRSLEEWATKNLGPEDEGSAFRLLLDMQGPDARLLTSDPRAPQALRDALRQRSVPSSQGALWDQLRALQQWDREQLLDAEAKLAAAKARLADAENELARDVDAQLAIKMRRAAWKPLTDEVAALFRELHSSAAAELSHKLAQEGQPVPSVEELTANISLYQRLRTLPLHELVALGLLTVATAVIPVLLAFWKSELSVVGLPSALLSVFTAGLAVYRGLDNFARRVRPLEERYSASVAAERQRIASEREELIRARLAEVERTDAAGVLPALGHERQQVRELEAKAAALRGRVSLTANYVSFTELVRARLDSALYAQHLGLVHQVQQDLIELTQSLITHPRDPNFEAKRQQFRRGPPRVMLFIDDLDRCPPETVVAVLEAAQLLVKTKLFVVVMAMDVRYVTRTLEKHYQGVLVRNGDPSGLDYIEKIIQIPYRVRPIGPDALRGYLNGQMRIAKQRTPPVPAYHGAGSAPAGSAPRPDVPADSQRQADKAAGRPPARALTFEPAESELLASCCERLDLSPRALKRLVNVYRVLKILWCRSSSHPQPEREVERAVLFLLALSCRYSDTLREPFDKIAAQISADPTSTQPFAALLCSLEPETRDALRKRSHAEMSVLVKDTKLMPQTLTLTQLGGPAFDLVRSFAFLGDSGLEPGDVTLALSHAPVVDARPPQPDDKAAEIANRGGGPV